MARGQPAGASIAVPEAERYVSRTELAELMRVSVATIDRWVRAGMPSDTWGLRARRFRPSTAIAWARARGMQPSPPVAVRMER